MPTKTYAANIRWTGPYTAVSPCDSYVVLATTSGESESKLRAIPMKANIQYQRLRGKGDAGNTKTNVRRAKT